jgi:hypothetical protein
VELGESEDGEARIVVRHVEATRLRDQAHTLSDFRVPTLSIECEPCGRYGRYNIANLMEQYGDAKLPELLYTLADCLKARSTSVAARPSTAKTADGARHQALEPS